MKRIIAVLSIIIIIFSCEREWKNPFDSSAQINKYDWSPSNLTVAQTLLGTVELTWSGVDKNIEGYKVDRKLNDDDWTEELITITDEDNGTVSVIDSTIIPNSDNTYIYRVYAFAGLNESHKLTEQVDMEFPPVSNLKLDIISPSINKLRWEDNANGEDGYVIERKIDGNNYVDYAILSENSTQFVDSAVVPEETNYYRVSGVYGDSRSDGVVVSMVSTFQAPSELILAQQSISSVKLSWQDNSEGEDGFYIDRKIGDGDWKTKYATVDGNVTEFTDRALTPKEYYHYNVYAYSGQTTTDKANKNITLNFDGPGNLDVEQVNLSQLDITWQDQSEGEEGFRLFRQDSDGQWQLITTTTNSYFSDTDPEYGQNWYKVYAYCQDVKSDSVEIMFDNRIEKPINLVAEVIDNSTIQLSWNNQCEFDHRLSVERRLTGMTFEPIALLDYGTTEYKDDEVDSTEIYEYAVRAYVEPYYSDYSNVVSVQTLPPLPFEMVEVPAGNFTYGSSDIIETISYDYVIMKYEVTNQQYAEYLQEALENEMITVTSNAVTGSFKGDGQFSSGDYLYYDLGDENARIYFSNDQFYAESGYSDHPVTEVTWFGANGFAEYYRTKLPSEYEWEKAARGNTGDQYPWGDDFDSHYCNYHSSGDPYDDGTSPVGFYNGSTYEGYSTLDNSSYYGAYDMAGNVWELTRDYYSESTDNHTVRGGSWYNSESFIYTYSRLFQNSEKGYSYIGFRIMRKQ